MDGMCLTLDEIHSFCPLIYTKDYLRELLDDLVRKNTQF